jgi:hypothetical protein
MFARVTSVIRRVKPVAACLFLFSPLSCTGSAQVRTGFVYDYPVVYAERMPARIRYYPRVYYRGRPAYLVRNRWYYETPRGWVFFRDEPRELRRFRRDRVESRREHARPRVPRDRRNLYRHRYWDRDRDAAPSGPEIQRRRRFPSE